MTGEESLIFAEKRENGNSYLDSVKAARDIHFLFHVIGSF